MKPSSVSQVGCCRHAAMSVLQYCSARLTRRTVCCCSRLAGTDVLNSEEIFYRNGARLVSMWERHVVVASQLSRLERSSCLFGCYIAVNWQIRGAVLAVAHARCLLLTVTHGRHNWVVKCLIQRHVSTLHAFIMPTQVIQEKHKRAVHSGYWDHKPVFMFTLCSTVSAPHTALLVHHIQHCYCTAYSTVSAPHTALLLHHIQHC